MGGKRTDSEFPVQFIFSSFQFLLGRISVEAFVYTRVGSAEMYI